MERWERNIMNAVGDPDDSADSYSSNDAGGYSTNPFVRLAAQLAGGGAAAIGGQLSYLGSLINGAHDYEDEPSIDQVLRQAGVGNFLLNNGEYLQNVGEDWNAHYKNHAWDGMSLGDRLTRQSCQKYRYRHVALGCWQVSSVKSVQNVWPVLLIPRSSRALSMRQEILSQSLAG